MFPISLSSKVLLLLLLWWLSACKHSWRYSSLNLPTQGFHRKLFSGYFCSWPWIKDPSLPVWQAAKHVDPFLKFCFHSCLGTWDSLNSHYWPFMALTAVNIFWTWATPTDVSPPFFFWMLNSLATPQYSHVALPWWTFKFRFSSSIT